MIREYLTKNIDGGYTLVNHKFTENDIEVPEWANYAYNNDLGVCFLIHEIKCNHPLLLWKRHTQPEELPFMDSLNDQYAEIEQVRQSAIKVESGGDSDHMADTMSYGYMGISAPKKHRHYFKDVSNIAEIDVYAVLKLFDVTDPCLQHIIKKALVAGGRGHKDLECDLKDIHDTSKRALEINNILH